MIPFPIRLFWLPVLASVTYPAAGCNSPAHRLAGSGPADGLQVVLDANTRVVVPGKRIKFFVDITNHTHQNLDLEDLAIELTAFPRHDPSTISLRGTWSYRWSRSISLLPGRRITLPIVPETGRVWKNAAGRQALGAPEFPLDQLSEGEYEVRATVYGRYTSPPYSLRVHRIDLPSGGRHR